jgi:predicted outer membrane repeat protein
MKKSLHFLSSAYVKLVFILLVLCYSKSKAAVRYVNIANLTPAAPYTSWASAGTDLQAVINQCVAGDDIWVVAGTYIPNRRADATGTVTANDRDNAFVLKNGVRIFGGFIGTEAATSERNFALNSTILSGDIGTAGNSTDNCYHVVVCAGTVTGTALNGFQIRHGNANGSGNITVNAISMGRGSGAGMRINSSTPTISNCVFSANSTTNNGGGMVCDGASPAITNCLFSGNTAVDAGGIYNVNISAPEIVNCSFSGNNATTTGGAIRNSVNSDPVISNCILWGNLAGGVANAIYNSDVASVPDVNYSLVQGGYAGTANVNADPLFVNPVAAALAPTLAGDYRIQKCSPALNGGLDSYVPGSINNDLDYTPRINYGKVDMGAYEKQLALAVPNGSGIVFVDYTKVGDGSSWANAVTELADALMAAKYNSSITQIWVAKGTYYPKYNAADGSSLACDNTNRDNSFVLVNNVKLYGGFNGNEAIFTPGNSSTNATFLSGDIGVLNTGNDNCHHVLISAGNVGTAEVNTLTINDGYGLNVNSQISVNALPVNRQSGAGIHIYASSPKITNCGVFENNALGAIAGNGGACFVGPSSQPEISRCFFRFNTAGLSGGAIFVFSALNTQIIDCSIYNNTAMSNGGGGIYVSANCRATIRNCYFDGCDGNYGAGILNSVGSNVSIVKCSFHVNNAIFGGGIHNNLSNPVIDSCSFGYNDAYNGAGISNYQSNPVIKNCSFSYNDANDRGGAIYSNDHSNASILKCSFNYNSADIGGGLHIEDQSNTNIDSCNFRYNSARIAGAVHNYSSSQTISNTEFVSNNSTEVGGAIFNVSNFSNTATNCKFLGNVTGIHGGAVSQQGPGLMSLYERCLFDSNRCTSTIGVGAAFYSLSTDNEFKDCIFRGNQAEGESAMRLVNSDSEFSNCLFSGNKSNTNKPVIYFNASDGLFSNCTISGNKMVSGSINSVFNGESTCNLIIYNSIIWSNQGTTAGASPINSAALTVTANYSLIEGGFAGTGNINTNPLFLNPVAAASAPVVTGNYHIKTCSPAINAGSNALIPSGITTDLDSVSRIKFTTVDMGAYEKHLPVPDGSGIVYVDSSNTVNEGNGSSWASAATELADALKAAITDNTIEEIWVAKGTYKPLYLSTDNGTTLSCSNSNRDNSFVLRPDVKLFGGFAGGETDTTARDFSTNQTVLSGDIGVAANNTDNSYHVLIASGAVGNAGMDGFTVTRGQADANTNYTLNGNIIYSDYGAGMFVHSSSPFLSQCSFINNYALDNGGAYAAFNSNSSFSKNFFSSNTAGKQGGAVNLQNCTIPISNTVFSANTVNGPGPNNNGGGLNAENSVLNVFGSSFISNAVLNGDGGGAVIDLSAGAVFTSCIFSGNSASNRAGGYYNLSSVSALHNCVFTGNTSGTGGGAGVYNALAASLTLTNSTISGNNTTGNGGGLLTASPCIVGNTVIHDNTATISSNSIYSVFVTPTVSNSIIQGGYAGTGNYDINPLFIAPVPPAAAPTPLGDYHLQACSPAVNLGDNSFIPPGLAKDLDSLDRIQYTTVDLGAYETQTIDLATTTWRGFNTNWNDKINWCGGYIPSDTTNVTVPVTSNNPLINAGFDNEVKNISMASNTSIGIANTGKFTINGTYTNFGCTISNSGTWVMAGNSASQTFPGVLASVSAMKNLEVNNPSGLKFDKSFELTGTLTPIAGNINLDNATVTLNSDPTTTARVAAVPSGVAFSYAGTGKFEIERYIPQNRSWRLLTAPVSAATNLTISQAWQEGVSNSNRLAPVNPSPGFGTTITKSTSYNVADGYDQGSTSNPSIRYFNGINWGGFPSGTSGNTPGANNGLINDQPGYMLFIRGDRSIQVAGVGVPSTATTLRPKGQLKTGPQTIVCNRWTIIGNPYASPINFHKIVLDNPGLSDVFYVWDSKLPGSNYVGSWVTYHSYNTPAQTYTVTPTFSGTSFANNKGDISSGSAFMIFHTGTITINENHKSAFGENALFRPARQMSMNLYAVEADSTESLNDGAAIKLDAASEVPNAEKNTNFTENLAIAHDNKRYAVLNLQRLQFNDTVFIYSGQMKQREYVLELQADELNMPHQVKAFLEDTYLHQYKPVALEGSTRYAFTVNADSSSVSAARFRLLFKKSAKFRHIHAAVKEKDIEVQWQMEEDFGIERYEIERSANGLDFAAIGTLSTNRNQSTQIENQWLDMSPATGTCYYRIKATGMDGGVLYSEIIRVSMVNSEAGMYVYPNPVTDNTIRLRLNNQPAGTYSASFTNQNGQKIFTRQWQHGGGFVDKVFELPSTIPPGLYQLAIIKADTKREVLAVEIK